MAGRVGARRGLAPDGARGAEDLPPRPIERADRPSCPAPNPVRRRLRPSPPTAAAGSPVGGSARGLPTMTTMARFTTPETLPEGDEKVEAVRTMFDAIAPRYDLVNRIMTFRMDVRWRRRTVASLELGRGATVLDLACGTGDLCRELQRRRSAADRRRPVLRDARRGPHRCPARARRRPAPPAARWRRRRGHLRVRPAQLRQPPALLRRAGADRAARRAASPSSRWPSHRTGSFAGATASTSGRWCPWSAGSCPTRPPTATCPDRSPTSPSPMRCWTQLRTAGFADVERRLLSVGIAQLITARREAADT